ncbi:hypothetical protein RchiOBHm_Chr5g0006941 [Rosa chinensis]|uniref:Sugar phosphate transporter domain-containing protein n=1 Tax=Rosa chinensis TaxID=74649 RepID=A0A2P6Q3S4_ROSCH|nr:hypothetical protein RchiOBHm_Chr5g0006941 [Rosa chinensis]
MDPPLFATTLTESHFSVTAVVGFISNASGYSASKHVPLWELIWFSLVANASITGMNLSLMLNSVGFYQISKSGGLCDGLDYPRLQDDVWCICIHNALLLPSSILQHQSVPLHGRFSAVSFQVLFILGHMKTICVLTLGWLLFDSALTFKNLMGMALAVGGIIVYSWVGG